MKNGGQLPDKNHAEYPAYQTDDNTLLERVKYICGISAAMGLGRKGGHSAEKTNQKEKDREEKTGTYRNGCQVHRTDSTSHHCIDKAHTGLG